MQEKSQYDERAVGAISSSISTKGLVWGLIGGLAATIVIDLLTMAVLPLLGSPADGGFSIIGDTAAGFLALVGIDLAGGVPLGLGLHYLIGLVLGAVFGAAVTRMRALRLNSIRKSLGLGILFAEVISLPLVVLPPIILQLPASGVAQWLGFCLVMHGVWGTVLGLVVGWGVRSATRARV